MGGLPRRLGEAIRSPTAAGIAELLAALGELEARPSLSPRGARALARARAVGLQLRATLAALEGLLGGPPGGPGETGRAAREKQEAAEGLRRLLRAQLPPLEAEMRALGAARGAEEGLEGALGAFRDRVAEEGREPEGVELLLAGYRLLLAHWLGELAAALGGEG